MQKASPRFQLEQNQLVSKGAYSYIIQYDFQRKETFFDHKSVGVQWQALDIGAQME